MTRKFRDRKSLLRLSIFQKTPRGKKEESAVLGTGIGTALRGKHFILSLIGDPETINNHLFYLADKVIPNSPFQFRTRLKGEQIDLQFDYREINVIEKVFCYLLRANLPINSLDFKDEGKELALKIAAENAEERILKERELAGPRVTFQPVNEPEDTDKKEEFNPLLYGL